MLIDVSSAIMTKLVEFHYFLLINLSFIITLINLLLGHHLNQSFLLRLNRSFPPHHHQSYLPHQHWYPLLQLSRLLNHWFFFLDISHFLRNIYSFLFWIPYHFLTSNRCIACSLFLHSYPHFYFRYAH